MEVCSRLIKCGISKGMSTVWSYVGVSVSAFNLCFCGIHRQSYLFSFEMSFRIVNSIHSVVNEKKMSVFQVSDTFREFLHG